MVANLILPHLDQVYIPVILPVKGDPYECFTNLPGWNCHS